jgi:sterol desaturase/sphingolipid hydroxylase (fatty acid hydroxylase superfamily)
MKEQVIEFVGTHVVQLVCFWALGLLYLAIPARWPAFADRHKLQPKEKQPRPDEVAHCIRIVLRNQLFSSSLHLLLSAIAVLFNHKPDFRFSPAYPPITELVRDIVLCVLIREILFYYSHRFLHRPTFYAPIHKFHHRFTAPVSLAAQYAHPIEHLVSNIIPVSLPPKLLNVHILTWWAFLAIELVETTTVHSGFDFFGWAVMHDLHHQAFRVNFGTVGILDWLHGTGQISQPKEE